MYARHAVSKRRLAFPAGLGVLISFIMLLASAANSMALELKALGPAMIVSTGAGDASGYRIIVARSGDAIALDGAGHSQKQLPANVVDRFYRDVDAALASHESPSAVCKRTLVTPFPTFVTFHGQNSADISCQTDDKSSALLSDVQAIARVMYVSNYRVRAMKLFRGAPRAAAPSSVGPAPANNNYPPSGSSQSGY